MTVDEIKRIVVSVISAERTGYKLITEQYNLYLQKANIDLFNQSLKDWEKKQVVTDMLYPFKVKADLMFVAGITTRPTDYARHSAVYYESGSFGDWFLPSKDELQEMYTNLHAEGVGGFTDIQYWSSSEWDALEAYALDFGSNTWGGGGHSKATTFRVRACHLFIAEAGVYSLRDTGPRGGLIFYINGTTYYEAAASDQSTSQAWSNITMVAVTGTGTAIGTGVANTALIIAQAGHTDSAAKLCDDLTLSVGDEGFPTVPVEEVTDAELPDRISNAITAPTSDYPIICFYNERINILPIAITTGVDLLYIKKPTTPAYVRIQDAYSRSRYLGANFYTLTVTIDLAPVNAETHQITVNYAGGGAVTICDYTHATTNGTTKQVLAQRMAESVNNLYLTTGYFASVGVEEFTIYLNSSVGLNTDYVVAEAGTGTASFTAATPLQDGSGGSTELEWDEMYHPDIIRLIVGYTGIDVKDSLIIQAIDREKQENVK